MLILSSQCSNSDTSDFGRNQHEGKIKPLNQKCQAQTYSGVLNNISLCNYDYSSGMPVFASRFIFRD